MTSSDDNATTPRVSVIIATYNWSAALRCALTSVRRQAMRDFEVLVVGDCCTDDSADVVAGFQDSRFHWQNLGRNHRSQWAPNNAGLQVARGTWIAYLGHDDIWHPEHLAALINAVEKTPHAVGAVSGLLMYGPPGTGRMQFAGFYESGWMQKSDVVPPSTLMHRRDIIQHIGPWTDAELIELHTDCDFEMRLLEHGPVVSTGKLTVFKFDASARRDVYIRKNVNEQQDMLHRLESDPDHRHRELARALAAFNASKLENLKMPHAAGVAPGQRARANRKSKGVDPRFGSADMQTADQPLHFSLESVSTPYEWHSLEARKGGGTYRWSGPLTASIIDLPVVPDRCLVVSIGVVAAVDPDLLNTIRLRLNDSPVEHRTRFDEQDETTVIEITGHPKGPYLQITIEVERTIRPIDLGAPFDGRYLGIAVAWISVRPRR